jgi:hypothetical protein
VGARGGHVGRPVGSFLLTSIRPQMNPARVMITTNMSLLTLTTIPDDVLLEIILWARSTKGYINKRTLTSLLVSCQALSGFMKDRWDTIETHYTITTHRTGSFVIDEWRFCGLLHRRDGPASIHPGYQVWCRWGKRHSINDSPASINRAAQSMAWYSQDRLHRNVDLPASYCRWRWEWYINGVRRRKSTGPTTVFINWEPDYDLDYTVMWDGHSDVSAADFDWGCVIDPRLLSSNADIRVVYVWDSHDNNTIEQRWRLVCVEGRYVITAV